MYEDIIDGFTRKLDDIIQSQQLPHIKRAEKGIKLCNEVLSILQNTVEQDDFEDINSEISFFKEIKPYPMSYLIYFTEVRSCELRIPKLGTNHKLRFLEKEIKKVNKFFSNNSDFVHYMEQSHTYLDHQFFSRNHRNSFPLTPMINYYQYPEFSTSHDMLWAKAQALYRFIHYIREYMERVRPGSILGLQEKKHKLLMWTESKTALIELIYALYSQGAINQGAVELSAITSSFEDFFNVKLDNIYKTYSEIKNRKGSKTKFIEDLMIHLQHKIEKEDAL